MFNRLGIRWRLCMILIVIWTIAVFSSVWVGLPQARDMAHDPGFMNKLSPEAVAILLGTGIKVRPIRGSLIWSKAPRIVRMQNGTELTFPTLTTVSQTAFVANEYGQLLNTEAQQKRFSYLMEALVIWLAPCCCLLIAGYKLKMLHPGSVVPLLRRITGDYSPAASLLPVSPELPSATRQPGR